MSALRKKLEDRFNERTLSAASAPDWAWVMRQIRWLRNEAQGHVEFARLVVWLIDSMNDYLADLPPCPMRHGKWDDEERAILRDVYSKFTSGLAPEEAEKRIHRTRSQIVAMAGNMKLKR